MRHLLQSTKFGFSYRNFGKLSFDPFEKKAPPTDSKQLQQTV